MTSAPTFSAAILVGGEARRLAGVDKSALLVEGRSILDRQLTVLRGLTPAIRLVARDAQRYRDAGVPVVLDRRPGAGPLGGIYTALLESRADVVIVLACDMPFVTAPLLARLVELCATADAAVPRDASGPHPLCAAYRVGLAEHLRERIDAGALSVRAALAGCHVRDVGPDEVTSFDPDGRVLLNVNTPDDYARALVADSPRAPFPKEYPRRTRHEPRTTRMILPVHDQLRTHLSRVLATLYSLDADSLPAVVLEYPPSRDLGDLATPLAFELARRLRKAPRAIAQEVAGAFGSLEGVTRIAAAANGYLNVFLDRPRFLLDRLANAAPATPPAPGKAIVEHTAINPNKAAHVGHLRNAALGDTLVRVLRFRGVPVEVQNYIDDTGVQVADVVVGFRVLEGKSLDEVCAIADSTRFDYYCWNLYAKVGEWYAGDKERLEQRGQTLHDIEHGGNENAAIAAFIADRIVRCHLKTMARMNVDYDLLTWEGDILRLKFWAQAFDVLKAKGAVFLQNEGRLAGCWVMPIQEDLEEIPNPKAQIPTKSQVPNPNEIPNPKTQPPEPEAGSSEPDAEGDDEQREKVIVRSNGTVTYVGKDIAYQFWKLGLLGRDFEYRVFEERPTGPLWATCGANGLADHPMFGGAAYVYNVIDVRQSYLQKLLKQALLAVGHPEAAGRSHHFSYEMVALSHATARELGFAPPPDSEDAKRPFVEVSGRKGLGVKADDLLDTLIAKAGEEVRKRNAELSDADANATARAIGIAAVRYFLIKFSRGKVIAFDLDEALSFEGESGPYIQYAVVRANNIFQKLQQREGLDEAALLATLKDVPAAELTGENGSHEVWALVLEASRLDEVVEQVIRSLEFSVLAKYAFSLAQAFNAFYHRSQILNEERDDVKRWRAAAVIYLRQQLTRALDLMGVTVPTRM